MSENDLTIIFYTANFAPDGFTEKTRANLSRVAGNVPIISVSQKPMEFGKNICVGEIGRSHLNIYRQALAGAKVATTKYIAMAEDDILYSPEHFTRHTPSPGKFAYNLHVWALYTWGQKIFSFKDRRNLHSLVCERELFIEAMEERFLKYPDDILTPICNWAEPGKYEKNLGVTERDSEVFYTDIANVAFSHQTALSYENLGTRKRLGKIRATAIEHWGTAEKILNLYK